jgi:hypothetical protein
VEALLQKRIVVCASWKMELIESELLHELMSNNRPSRYDGVENVAREHGVKYPTKLRDAKRARNG